MYINYYELKNFVIELFEKYNTNDMNGLFNCIDKCIFLNDILNNIEILVDNDTYNLLFTGNYIGSMKSDLHYDINSNKTKVSILKYVLYKDPSLLLNLLKDLINVNNYILKNDNNANINIRRNIVNTDKKFEDIGNDILKTGCEVYYYVYSNNVLIGIFKYNGNYYTTSKKVKFNENIKMTDKELIIRDMERYNKSYCQSIMKDKGKLKNKSHNLISKI